jgi:hypothetical protein
MMENKKDFDFSTLHDGLNQEQRANAFSFLIGVMESYFEPEYEKTNMSKENLFNWFSKAVENAIKESK